MNSVLISIRPKWCELIASGRKTIEVRKSRPKLETPFKCYIYCRLNGSKEFFQSMKAEFGDIYALTKWNSEGWGNRKGKVIGEFICDRIFSVAVNGDSIGYVACDNMLPTSDITKPFLEKTCLSIQEIHSYFGCFAGGYGWHISDLKIYDEPKYLSEFNAICPYKNPDGTRMDVDCPCDKYTWDYEVKTGKSYCTRRITRPPHSWCYVEEFQE